jgi:hypothetical protein
MLISNHLAAMHSRELRPCIPCQPCQHISEVPHISLVVEAATDKSFSLDIATPNGPQPIHAKRMEVSNQTLFEAVQCLHLSHI